MLVKNATINGMESTYESKDMRYELEQQYENKNDSWRGEWKYATLTFPYSFHLQPHNIVYGKSVWMMYFSSAQ